MPRPPSAAALADLQAVVGAAGCLTDAAAVAPFLADHRRLYRGATPLVLLPKNTGEASRLLAICHRELCAVVPHGGNTGYCGGATPDSSGTQIVLALQRMQRIRSIDRMNLSLIAEAGCTLSAVQEAAQQADRLFPLSLGSEGTAQIGGVLSTNAGGTAVLRYGMARDLVFGLEAVLADGRVLSVLKALRKDNTGYDIKSLLIGAEGTLGIITAANLKLFPQPQDAATALAGVDSPAAALALLQRLRDATGDMLTGFELMPRFAVEITALQIAGVANPLALSAAWFVLVELAGPGEDLNLRTRLEATLAAAHEAEVITDATVAMSMTQAEAMWKLRESIPEAQTRRGASLKHDVSVPVSLVPELIQRGGELIARLAPLGDMIAYGHMGDGNLHFNASLKVGAAVAEFRRCAPVLEQAMFDLVESLGGSISAEHGIGQLKAAEFARRADPVEIALMHALKRTLDPRGILNPGKVLLSGP
jgi:FAD/FMN-containing dehydrogenase